MISACLLGEPVRYDGRSCPLIHPDLETLKKYADLIPFCPEVAGGLAIPRPPAEIRKNRIVTREKQDVTAAFERGANLALDQVLQLEISLALLKEKSPSCGVNQIYDGTFSGQLIPGKGATAKKLEKAGVETFSEDDIHALLLKIAPE